MPRAARTPSAPAAAPRPTGPAVTAPATHDTTRQTAGRFVTVACKMPNGVILQLFKKLTRQEQTREGIKEVVQYDRDGDQVIIAGPAYPVIPPVGYPRQVAVEGGFALTRGVPAAFWDKWLEQNRDNPLYKNGHIFAHSSMDSVVDEAREKEKMVTGFQPLDMRDDGKYEKRMPKPGHGISFKHDPRNSHVE